VAKIGYARVSSVGQSLEVQLEKLEDHGCKSGDGTIFSEKLSGLDSTRPELKACLKHLRKGDSLVITKLDRLARSTRDLTAISQDLDDRKIGLKVLDQDIDTSTPTGKLLFNLLASIAEFETALRKERQTDGIKKALDNGVKFGRVAKLTEEEVEELRGDRREGMSTKDMIGKYGLSRASIYRLTAKEE